MHIAYMLVVNKIKNKFNNGQPDANAFRDYLNGYVGRCVNDVVSGKCLIDVCLEENKPKLAMVVLQHKKFKLKRKFANIKCVFDDHVIATAFVKYDADNFLFDTSSIIAKMINENQLNFMNFAQVRCNYICGSIELLMWCIIESKFKAAHTVFNNVKEWTNNKSLALCDQLVLTMKIVLQLGKDEQDFKTLLGTVKSKMYLPQCLALYFDQDCPPEDTGLIESAVIYPEDISQKLSRYVSIRNDEMILLFLKKHRDDEFKMSDNARAYIGTNCRLVLEFIKCTKLGINHSQTIFRIISLFPEFSDLYEHDIMKAVDDLTKQGINLDFKIIGNSGTSIPFLCIKHGLMSLLKKIIAEFDIDPDHVYDNNTLFTALLQNNMSTRFYLEKYESTMNRNIMIRGKTVGEIFDNWKNHKTTGACFSCYEPCDTLYIIDKCKHISYCCSGCSGYLIASRKCPFCRNQTTFSKGFFMESDC